MNEGRKEGMLESFFWDTWIETVVWGGNIEQRTGETFQQWQKLSEVR
jgi:hypothetical protein